MSNSAKAWKKGRGKLGPLEPLIGKWHAVADTEAGEVRCTRTFTHVLDGAYIQLTADWEYTQGSYKELALFGVGGDGQVHFWSFTSDKKQSNGHLADVTDIHPQAIGFEAQMPAGLARQVYWPDDQGGFHWVVESKTKKGWNRFVEHRYSAVQE
jgi:hypothetical protein